MQAFGPPQNRRWRVVLTIALCVLLGLPITVLTARWPYTPERIKRSLGNATGSRVEFHRFIPRFFPSPGCTLEQLRLTRDHPTPIALAERLEIRSSWHDLLLLRRRVRILEPIALRVQIPMPAPPAVTGDGEGQKTAVERIEVKQGLLDVIPSETRQPLRFTLNHVVLTGLGEGAGLGFTADLVPPHPGGRITASGSLENVRSGSLANIAARGRFQISDASLTPYQPLAGVLSAQGQFQGPLGELAISGDTSVAGLVVRRQGQPLDLRASYDVIANATTGAGLTISVACEAQKRSAG